MPIESVMPSRHLILCHPLLLLPPIPPSIRVFSNESTLHMRWPKYWSFSFSLSPSNEHPGLISFRIDWLDLLAFQGILKSLLQHHSSKASIPWRSAFFTVQLSHLYMTTGKTTFDLLFLFIRRNADVLNKLVKAKYKLRNLLRAMGFRGGSDGKESICSVGDLGLIPGLGRFPGGGHGDPLQYSCLENHLVPGRLQSMGSQKVRHD